MEAYERAIRRLVRPGDVVVDLGCGTGILAMLAARCGAGKVYAIESMPIGGLAAQLIAANGLSDRIEVLRGQAEAMTLPEPVDLILSEFMGSFLVDDGMLDAVAAAARWLKPGGRCCPARLELRLAPVGGFHLNPLELFNAPIYGLSFGPARHYAFNQGYSVQLGPGSLLGPARLFEALAPPEVAGAFDRRLSFSIERDGLLQGVAGWFVATLAEGVILSTEPGIETHWGQYLFPIPPVPAQAGDRLYLHLRLEQEEGRHAWRWAGTLERDGEVVQRFALESDQRLGERRLPPAPEPGPVGRQAALEASARGTAAFLEGRLLEAVEGYEAAVRALEPADLDLAPAMYENLGLAYLNLHRYKPAARAFLRALDGAPESRPQALRFLISSLVHENRHHDAARYLACHEEAFGPHPEGWTPEMLAECCAGNRRPAWLDPAPESDEEDPT